MTLLPETAVPAAIDGPALASLVLADGTVFFASANLVIRIATTLLINGILAFHKPQRVTWSSRMNNSGLTRDKEAQRGSFVRVGVAGAVDAHCFPQSSRRTAHNRGDRIARRLAY